jgi:hypothetical protein
VLQLGMKSDGLEGSGHIGIRMLNQNSVGLYAHGSWTCWAMNVNDLKVRT